MPKPDEPSPAAELNAAPDRPFSSLEPQSPSLDD